MSSTVGQEDWQALIEVLQEAIQALSGKQTEPVKLKILEFSSTAAMLELQDLADCAGRFEGFLLSTVAPDWDDEATATLSFSMGALVEKMQMSSYSPAFSAGLGEVLMYLDFYGDDEGAAEPEPEPPAPPPAEALEPVAESSPTVPATPEREGATVSAPPTEAPSAVDEDALLAEIFAEVESSEAPHDESLPEDAPAPAVTSVASEPPVVPRPRPTPPEYDTDVDGYVIDRLDWYREVLREDPRSRLFVVLGEELCESGFWDQAIEVCRQGLAYHPDSLRGQVLLGRALLESGRSAEAHAVLIEAHRAIADNAILYRLLARMVEAGGESRLVDGLRQTGRFLEEESRRLASDRVARSPMPISPPRAKAPVPQPPVESPDMAPVPPGPETGTVEAGVLGWLLRLQDVFVEREAVSPVISPLFSDEDRAALRALLTVSVS